jgi:uncharacterized membrane protein YccC
MGDLSIHVTHGFKTALAAVMAYAITAALSLEFGFWAVISTVIVMQVYVADSVEMCLYRFSGTLIGALLGVVALLVVHQTPVFIGISLFVTIGLCSFLTRYRTRYRMAGITVVIVIMTGMQAQDIFDFGVARVVEICIGIFCAFAVSVLVLPKRKVDVLRAKLEAQAMACADRCRLLVEAFLSKQRSVEEAPVSDLANSAVRHELECVIAELDAKLLTIRKEGLIRRFDTHKLLRVFSFYGSLRYYSEDILCAIDEALQARS